MTAAGAKGWAPKGQHRMNVKSAIVYATARAGRGMPKERRIKSVAQRGVGEGEAGFGKSNSVFVGDREGRKHRCATCSGSELGCFWLAFDCHVACNRDERGRRATPRIVARPREQVGGLYESGLYEWCACRGL